MTVPRLRQSLAKTLLSECPAFVKLELDGERRAGTKVMRRGSLVDQLVFGGAQYEVVQARLKSGTRKGELATDWKCKEAQDMRDAVEAKGWIPVLSHELDSAQELAGRIKAELILSGIDVGKCVLQKTLEWTTPLGVEAQGTPDVIMMVDANTAHTIDLKVGDSANPRFIAKQVYTMGWDLQGAVYQEAVRATYGTSIGGQHWICRADPRTKLIGLYPLSPVYMVLGLKKWEQAQAIWKQCLATDEWPGYPRDAIEPPRWAVHEGIGYDDDLSSIGLDFGAEMPSDRGVAHTYGGKGANYGGSW